MNVRLLLAIVLATGVFAAQRACAQVNLTGIIGFSASSDGSTLGGEVWNTRGDDSWFNLYVTQGGLNGAFINSGNGPGARVSVPLTPGTHTFTLIGDLGAEVPHQALNLFFNNNDTNPGISVVAELNRSATPPFPPFAVAGAAGSRALDGDTLVDGAGSLLFSSGGTTVELTDFRWTVANIHGIDRVDAISTNPNGIVDVVGQFTLQVTVPEPSALCLAGALAAIALRPCRRTSRP